jgi:F420-non-reducing hydrogenase iron-sulfur subunit
MGSGLALGKDEAQGAGQALGMKGAPEGEKGVETERDIETDQGMEAQQASEIQRMLRTEEAFEPAIVGFLCNWCSYAGADLAGTSRLSYPTNLRVIRVMCSGRVDPGLMLEPFQRGADGVMVLGCHPADCHYLSGNYQAEQRVLCVQAVMEHLGIAGGRLCLDWVSAAEGARFAELVAEFVTQVKRLGPIGCIESQEGLPKQEFTRRVQVAKRVVEGEKFRWLVGRRKALLEEENVYREQLSGQRFHNLMKAVVAEECLRAAIELLAEEGPISVKDMAETLGLSAREVLEHTAYLKKSGFLELYDVVGSSPRYVSSGYRRLKAGIGSEGLV